MRKVPFPPFGFGFLEFGLLDLISGQFSAQRKMDCAKHGQKDAQGAISPLRVRILGSSPPGLDFGVNFWAFEK